MLGNMLKKPVTLNTNDIFLGVYILEKITMRRKLFSNCGPIVFDEPVSTRQCRWDFENGNANFFCVEPSLNCVVASLF